MIIKNCQYDLKGTTIDIIELGNQTIINNTIDYVYGLELGSWYVINANTPCIICEYCEVNRNRTLMNRNIQVLINKHVA